MITSTKANSTGPTLIAPCGINCRLFLAYGRDRKPCPGCQGENAFKPPSCAACRIKNCARLASGQVAGCVKCDQFPCERLAHLDKRYRTKYGASPIENLISIEEIGMLAFIKNENEKWSCPNCGMLLCMHSAECLSCGVAWH